jgi:4'-phosphopantetheinyl transferase EntD
MGLIEIKTIGDSGLAGLWQIQPNEPEPDFFQEDTYLQSITSPVRRLASVSARLLVKELLDYWNEPYTGIIKNENGQPSLYKQPYFISITHGGDYAAAILHKKHAVGIDIEYKKEKILKVAPRIFSAEELAETGSFIDKLTLYFSAKEVLYKLFGERQLSFRENIHILPFVLADSGVFQAQVIKNDFYETYQVHYEMFEEFVLAYGF